MNEMIATLYKDDAIMPTNRGIGIMHIRLIRILNFNKIKIRKGLKPLIKDICTPNYERKES